LGEYAWIIAFGDEILRCKISHHISLAPLDSFSSRRSLDPYHAFGLFDKSKFVRVTMVQFTLSVASRHLSQRERQGTCANFKQSDKSEVSYDALERSK